MGNAERYNELFGGASKKDLKEFLDWRKSNPHIFAEFCRLAAEYKNNGESRLSHWLIASRVREAKNIGPGNGPYKIKNIFITYMARALIYKDPSYAGLFPLGTLRGSRKR